MKKGFLLLIKYFPIIQMVGMLVNNTLYYFDFCLNFARISNYFIGNSVIMIILLYICSFLFGYCNWYRIILFANLTSITINIIDTIIRLPISDKQLLVLYYSVCVLFLFIIILNKFKCSKKASD